MLTICHAIAGRVRLNSRELRGQAGRCAGLERFLKNQEGCITVRVKPVTGSIIIVFDPATGQDELIEVVTHWIGKSRSEQVLSSLEPSSCSLECASCKRDHGHPSLIKQVAGLVLLSIYVGYAFVRRVFFKSPVSESALSLTSVVAVAGAWPLLKHAWQDLKRGRHKSLFPFLAATCFLAIFLGEAMTALEVIWIMRLGMLLEEYVARRSRAAIRNILKLAEKNTYLLVDGVEIETPVAVLRPGDVVICHTGEKIPVDGVVIEGEALVNESPITGRAEHEQRMAGHKVFAGTIISQGVLVIKAEKVGDDTYLCRILHLVENALETKAPVETKADELATRLMRFGAIAVVGTFLITLDPVRAFTVLLVLACPCATVLAASTAVAAAIATAARHHILIKGGLSLEQIGSADCFCFDKTGTLTSEVPRVVEILPRDKKQSADSILAMAASAEAHNQHPVARALIEAARERGFEVTSHDRCEFVLGRGVRAEIKGDIVLIGNAVFMKEEGIDIRYFKRQVNEHIARGNTVIYVAKNKKMLGIITIANTIRPEAEDVLRWLRKDGTKELHLITGDMEPVARSMAEAFGFNDYKAELLPEGKAQYIKILEKMGKKTVMVGDGVNDALALAEASIGVAMGAGGAEVAIESADIALVDSDLKRIVMLRKLSKQTMSIIEQNHQIAMLTNIGGVVLGASGLLSPVMAGALHVIHTLGIFMNSGRLLGWRAEGEKDNKRRRITDGR